MELRDYLILNVDYMKRKKKEELKEAKTIVYQMDKLDLATANSLRRAGIVIDEIDAIKGIAKAHYEKGAELWLN